MEPALFYHMVKCLDAAPRKILNRLWKHRVQCINRTVQLRLMKTSIPLLRKMNRQNILFWYCFKMDSACLLTVVSRHYILIFSS